MPANWIAPPEMVRTGAVPLPELVHVDQVGVLQPRGQLRLVEELRLDSATCEGRDGSPAALTHTAAENRLTEIADTLAAAGPEVTTEAVQAALAAFEDRIHSA